MYMLRLYVIYNVMSEFPTGESKYLTYTHYTRHRIIYVPCE